MKYKKKKKERKKGRKENLITRSESKRGSD